VAELHKNVGLSLPFCGLYTADLQGLSPPAGAVPDGRLLIALLLLFHVEACSVLDT